MSIDAKQKKLLIDDLTLGLPAAAWTLRSERRKFSAHLLRVACMRHVYETLRQVAENLDILNVTLIDLFLTEGIEMDKNTIQQRAAEEAQAAADNKLGVNSTDATSSKGQEATKPTEPAGDIPGSRGEDITEEQQKQYACLAKQLASAITESYGRTAQENRRLLLDAMPAAIGMIKILSLLERIVEQMASYAKQLNRINDRLDLMDRWCAARQKDLELVDKKFAGIGKALDVIARAVQKNMAAGNNHDPEQGG